MSIASTASLPASTVNPYDFWNENTKNLYTQKSTPTNSEILGLVNVPATPAAGTTPASPATAWHMGASLTTIKNQGMSLSSQYFLGWSTQVNTKTAPAAGNVQLQWFAPMWVAADPTGSYVNYICQNTISAGTTAGTTTATPQTFAAWSANDLVTKSSGQGSAATIASAGTVIPSNSFFAQRAVSAQVADANGWFANSCQGYRSNADTTALISAFKVGDVVNFRGGFKYLKDATASSTTIYASPAMSVQSSFTITDGAAALTMSAAVAAVLALAF